ncbi:prepilin-type cleavage/methylation domain-containing protein [Lysobacteraceae bacterium NML91-0213]|nr:prepilin-type cleavage/methylation domain-containing protein [Xanthomonadaceae bacterium NML91-0213]
MFREWGPPRAALIRSAGRQCRVRPRSRAAILSRGGDMHPRGFTLIELLIVIASLAAIAVPAYQVYVARSQVAEGLAVAGGVKTALAEFHADHGSWPTGHAALPLASPASISGRYVSATSVGSVGRITIAYATAASSARIRGHALVLVPQISDNSLHWTCERTMASLYRPALCR